MNPQLLLAALAGIVIALPVGLLAEWLPARFAHTEAVWQRGTRLAGTAVVLALLSVFAWQRAGFGGEYAVLMAYLALFALVGVIDIEHKLVLNVVMLPAFAFALVEVLLNGRATPIESLAGFAIAQIVVMAFFLLGGVYQRGLGGTGAGEGEEDDAEIAFGFGDVTLATFCGLVVGYPRVIPMLVLMVLAGAALAVVYLIVQAVAGKGYRGDTALPYAPAILIAATVMLLWAEPFARMLGAP